MTDILLEDVYQNTLAELDKMGVDGDEVWNYMLTNLKPASRVGIFMQLFHGNRAVLNQMVHSYRTKERY